MEFLTGVIPSGMITIVFLVCSCSPSPVKNNRIIKKPPSSYEDSVVIDRKSAVFYNPDSLQLVKIKSVNEERIYKNLTHDCFYQMENARNVIRRHWPGIAIVEVTKARWLLFIKNDNRKMVIDLNAKNDICGLFLFDPKKDPETVDMPNIDTFLGFYFGQ
jgi:hypothetical protein